MKKYILLFSVVLGIGAGLYFYLTPSIDNSSAKSILQNEDFFSAHVQPIFNSKCIACHSCFNSPCQLNLTSYEGVTRGASQTNIYDFPKIEAREPTRLYIDAQGPQQWRKKGFFPVISEKQTSLIDFYISSLNGIESGKQKTYKAEESRTCTKVLTDQSIDEFISTNPAGRMPYGFNKLSNKEIQTIRTWQDMGAPGPELKKMERTIVDSKNVSGAIKIWETFFNQNHLKAQISARYFYEHLFLAHIYFENHPNLFFRLVRSKTATGPIEEIGTSFPFDDPGSPFSYRLRPITNSIVHKSSIPFELSEAKMGLWKKDFIDAKWDHKPQQMPAYGAAGSNPFKTFAHIPVQARYNFFLRESNYHIMTFIKGPVCRGQTALNVINDHFWVLFMDPKKDALSNSAELYDEVARTMTFPSSDQNQLDLDLSFRESYWTSLKKKYQHLERKKTTLDPSFLWNGQTSDPNALITVYRHYDSAMTLQGLRGRVPKTVWVLDYHVFESIYYNLTAGYNVFGPILHQLNSRLYMEMSRIGSEDLFLSFMPKDQRAKIRRRWNQKTPEKKDSFLKNLVDLVSDDVKEKMTEDYHFHGSKVATSFISKSDDPKREFLDKIISETYDGSQAKRELDIYSNPQTRDDGKQYSALERLARLSAKTVEHLPDTVLLKVGDESIYTLVHTKDHYNVSMIFFEDLRRRPQNDYIDVVQGTATSYPNLFVILSDQQVPEFVQDLEQATSASAVWTVMEKFGLSRSDKDFWSEYEWFSKRSGSELTNEHGWLDLNRYLNI